MRIRIAVLALVALVLAPSLPAAGATCMKHGDADADGICDDVDPCRSADPHTLREPHVSVSRRLGGAGDAIVRFGGIIPLFDDEPADPAASGLRLILREGTGNASHVVVDVALAPSTGWVSVRPGEWIYRDPTVVDGIRRATVREIVPLPAYQAERAYVVSIDARTDAAPASDAIWHHASLILAAETPTTRCADQTFRPRAIDPGQTWQLWDGGCKTSITGATLRCRSGRLRSPCHVSRAEDEMRCLLADVARAQEEYYATNGTYCSSQCVDLLSMPQPAYTTVLTVGTSLWFETFVAHAASPGVYCAWRSTESPHLTCGPDVVF